MEYILDKSTRSAQTTQENNPDNIIVDTDYGKMIINRHDTIRGRLLATTGRSDDHNDIVMLSRIIDILGDNSIVIDVGANFGTHTLALAKHAGKVFAFEPQRPIYNILVGNVAINSLYNVYCYQLAVGDKPGKIEIPQYDYSKSMDFGAVEFGSQQRYPVDQQRMKSVEWAQMVTLDGLNFPKADMIKIDVEGMEQQVLDGALNIIKDKQPVLFVEHFKSDKNKLIEWIEALGYKVHINGMNILGIPTKLKETIRVTT